MKIAILGGTFDPVHHGHLAAAHLVTAALEVDEVYFVPAFSPPHKPAAGITSPFHRFAMVTLATAPFDAFKLSVLEADTLGPVYTVDTMEALRRASPAASFVFVTGTDLYAEIETWKDHRRLMALTSLAVVQRPGFPLREDIAPVTTVAAGARAVLGPEPRVYHFPALDHDVSSTRIREAARQGARLDRWVPGAVERYIVKHELYR